MDRHRSSQVVGICCALLVMVFGSCWVLTTTLIMLRLDTTVTRAEYQSGTSGHTRELKLADGRTLAVDRSLIKRAGGMDSWRHVSARKAAWQRQVLIDDRVVPLNVSSDQWRVLAALMVVVGFGCWARFRRRSTG